MTILWLTMDEICIIIHEFEISNNLAYGQIIAVLCNCQRFEHEISKIAEVYRILGFFDPQEFRNL